MTGCRQRRVRPDPGGPATLSAVTSTPAGPGAAAPPGPGDDLAERVAVRLRELRADPDLVLTSLTRLSGGASRETWSLTATTGARQRLRLVLRRDPPGDSRPEGMRREAEAITAAAAAGVLVPELVDWSVDPVALGSSYLLLRHVDGETLAPRLLREPAFAPARDVLAGQCGQALARIHAVPLRSVPAVEDGDRLALLFQRYDALGHPVPTFELAFRALQRRRPASSGEPALVHGDFRLGNLIVGPDGLRAVLDWELVHAGDPVEDLGWLCVRAWRFGGPHPVGGFGSREQLVTSYREAGGRPVDPAALHWWTVFGTLHWGVLCLDQVSRHLSGRVRSVELAAIGRRAAEQEHDLLTELPALASIG